MLSNSSLKSRQWLAAVSLLCLSSSVLAAEYRCGWIDNPGPGTWSLTDKDAHWEISTQGGYSVPPASIDFLPDTLPNQYVRTNGIYGYSCGCLTVDSDAKTRRILKIHQKGKQVFLKQCLEDTAIANRPQLHSAQPPSKPTPPPAMTVQTQVQTMSVPAAIPTTTPSSVVPHYVQVITTSDRNKANTLKNSFANRGFATAITSVQREGGVLYRVNFGPFESKAAAAQAQANLKGIFTDNVNVQESILVSVKSATPSTASTALPKTSTQCFIQRNGHEVRAIQLSVNRNRVAGFYAWQSPDGNSSRGFLSGTVGSQQITADHTYRQQAKVSTESLAFRYVKGGLVQGKSAQIDNISWSKPINYRTVNCREVQGLIGHAAKVQQQIQQK